MKKMTENFKTILFVIVLLCFASNAFAHGSEPNLKIINSEKKIFKLVAKSTKNSVVTILISDEQGTHLLREKIILNSHYSKSYDLSNLPKGTYNVEIEDHISFCRYIVTTSLNNLEIVANEEEIIYKPVINLEDNFILFNMLNLLSSDISLTIENGLGEEIYTEKIQNTKTIHKGYNLSNLPSGIYLLTVSTPTKNFNFEVNLK